MRQQSAQEANKAKKASWTALTDQLSHLLSTEQTSGPLEGYHHV